MICCGQKQTEQLGLSSTKNPSGDYSPWSCGRTNPTWRLGAENVTIGATVLSKLCTLSGTISSAGGRGDDAVAV